MTENPKKSIPEKSILEISVNKNIENPTSLRISAAAARLGVSDGTLRNWVSDGMIKCTKLPSGERRFDISEIERVKIMMNTRVHCPICKSYDTTVLMLKDGIPFIIRCFICNKDTYRVITKYDDNLHDGDIIPSKRLIEPRQQYMITIKERELFTPSKKCHGFSFDGKEYIALEHLEKETVESDDITIGVDYEDGKEISLNSDGISYIYDESGDFNGGKSKIKDIHIHRGKRIIFDLDPKRIEDDE